MKIIDWYILKRYLATFFVMLFMFIPIGIVIDVSEKINRILENDVAFSKVAQYYVDFTIYFANLLFPIFLFLSVIWFTSKLANNTEIIAILSSGISFFRFLRPYIIGATFISLLALAMGFYFVPKASKGFNDFRYTYLSNSKEIRQTTDVYKQISDSETIYVSSFSYASQMGYNFNLEKTKGNKLLYKITANTIKYNKEDSTYTLSGYNKRIIGELNDELISENTKKFKFNFEPDDLTPAVYAAETMTLGQLNRFIESEKKRGSGNISAYLVVKYKKYSLPVSAFILTVIAVAVSAMKRRGGMGINLALGIALAFIFIFFDKVFGTLASKSDMSPLIAVWIPNITFGILAIVLLRNARR
ncbi:LptF/LptG family permease [Flavobacterium rhizosphaerae]|uniref:LptF/LptG family permease n=1 Tax=Flavobacterium rhizosphaerae TaxID=3163298 RepID=A0ABW8YVK7_9FLAO